MKNKYILAAAIAALLAGCGGSGDDNATAGHEEKSMAAKVVDGAKDVAGKAVESTKDAAGAVVEGTKDAAGAAVDATKEAASAAVDKAKEVAGDAVEGVKEAAGGAVDKAKAAAAATGAAATAAVASATGGADGAKLFKGCAACHGPTGEMKAMNVSALLKGQSKDDIAKKLHGYKDGSIGGPMKAVMGPQAAKLSDADIDALADYVSKF